jgi:hypothetical protein
MHRGAWCPFWTPDLAMWRPWTQQERAGTSRRAKGRAGEKRSPPELPEKQIAIMQRN